METKTSLIFLASAILLFSGATAYTTQIHAPAVISTENSGILTLITLNLTSGNGAVRVIGPGQVGSDTLSSAQTAAAYASQYLGMNESRYNFTYDIHDGSSNVSGPSAGLAFTLLAYSALKHEQPYQNFTVTGTISSNGAVGQVGGVYDKLGAAKAAGSDYALVPYAASTDPEYLTYYITQQTFNIPMVLVANFTQALPYTSPSGIATPTPFTVNFTQNYYLSGLPQASVGCGCNESYFGQLINFTFNFTQGWASEISPNFTTAKSDFIGNINTYRSIASKGYLYAPADLAFLQYEDIFALNYAGNFTKSNAQGALDNVSAYCSSLSPPQLTSSNYEYVIGGRMRQYWAQINLKTAQQDINQSNTTDDVIFSLQAIAPSYAWCKSSMEMYNIASEIGGSPVGYSAATKADAFNAITSAKQYAADPLYIQSAEMAYNSSQYGTALYSAMYAQSFGQGLPSNTSSAYLTQMINANAANSTFGIWPSQFADTALFDVYQANARGGYETTNITAAYTTSVLAADLSKANGMLSSTFVPVIPTTSTSVIGVPNSQIITIVQNQTSSISQLNSQVSQIYSLLFVLTLVMAFIAVLLLVLLLRTTPKAESKAVPEDKASKTKARSKSSRKR